MNKIGTILSWLILLSAMVLMIVVFIWLNYPYKPIVFKDLPMKVVNKQVERGGHVLYTADYCKNMKIGATVTRSFVDSVLYTTPELVTNVDIGCFKNTASVYIPRALPLGVFHIKTVYRYKVNPLRTIDVITETEEFNIIK